IFSFIFNLLILYNMSRFVKTKICENEVEMKKIYIIDDDRDIVESMSMVLEANGYEVTAQYNDENVTLNVSQYNPDLIILDVMFPENGSAGFEIARDLKRDNNLTNIPIVMLSAVNERGIYLGRFTNQDIDESWLPISIFLDKPVQPKELLLQVKSILNE
ncbi:MAG: response regulator, partial [Actinobacteria bacterium]|nr:response regulator [Actinomycetota bacterium]